MLFLRSHYSPVVVTNDEIMLYHRLLGIRQENSKRLDRNDRETYTKLDTKYQKNFNRIVKQE